MSARMNQSDGHERMNDFANNQEQPPSQKKPSSNKSAVGDYIDFEEIK